MDKILFVIFAMLCCMAGLAQGQSCKSGEKAVTLEMFDVKQKNARKAFFNLMGGGHFRPITLTLTNIANMESIKAIVVQKNGKKSETYKITGNTMTLTMPDTGEDVGKVVLMAKRKRGGGKPSYDVSGLKACINDEGASKTVEDGQTKPVEVDEEIIEEGAPTETPTATGAAAATKGGGAAAATKGGGAATVTTGGGATTATKGGGAATATTSGGATTATKGGGAATATTGGGAATGGVYEDCIV